MQAVKREFSGYEYGQAFEVRLWGDNILLKIQFRDIPLPGGLVLDGWSITAENLPEVRDMYIVYVCILLSK